jgi:tetratricopeptide (TPR) repeat protein
MLKTKEFNKMASNLGQILAIKKLIDTKQFREAKMKLKLLQSDWELKRLFKFQILVQNKKTILKKFKITYYDNLKYFEELGEKKFLILFHNLAGDYYFDQNKFGHAINDYDHCLKFDKENTHAIMGLAKSYRLLGLYEISEKYYLKITHSYDWNLDNLEDNLETDIPLGYTSLRKIIDNKNFGFLSKKVLVDIGVLYASNNDIMTGKNVFEAILANASEQNTLDSSYLVATRGVSNRVYDDINKNKTRTKTPLKNKMKFIIKIENIFPEFSSKYQHEINKSEFFPRGIKKVLTVSVDTSKSKVFFIIEKKLPTKYGKEVYLYTIIPQQQKFEEITSALFLYLSNLISIKSLINTINVKQSKVYKSSNLNLPPEELLEFYLYSLNDNLALFLLKKKLHKENPLNVEYPFNYLKSSNQIIKEIREDVEFENKLNKLHFQNLNSFRKKLEESWDDYSKLPELVKIEDDYTTYRYNEITDYVKRRLSHYDKDKRRNKKKSIKS